MATKRKRKRKSESLKYKITAGVSRTLTGGDQAKGLRIAEEAKRLFLRTGETTEGVHLIGHWRNPDNLQPRHAAWKTSEDSNQTLEGFYRTIVQRTGAKSSNLPLAPTGPEDRIRFDELFAKRSAAAKRGVTTRRENAARAKKLAESLKRSKAVKRGLAAKAEKKQPGLKPKVRILGGKKKR